MSRRRSSPHRPTVALGLLYLLCTSTAGAISADQPSRCIADGAQAGLVAEVRGVLNGARERLRRRLAAPDARPGELASAYGELGQRYHVQLMFDQAGACYHSAAALAPEQLEPHYYLGYLYQQQALLGPAAEGFREVLALQPDHLWATLRLAEVLLDQEQHARARELLSRHREHPELRAWVQFQLGRLTLARGDYRAAVDHLQRALAADPDANRIHYPLAMAWRGLGERQRARAQLDLRGDREPAFPDPLVAALDSLALGQTPVYSQAMRLVRQQAYHAAAAAFREGLARDPKNLNARTSLARALFLAAEAAPARAELERVVATAPLPLAVFLLGVLDEAEGRYQAAEARYRQALEQNPEHGGAHFALARRLTAGGAFSAAASHFRRAWELVPDNAPARLWEVLVRATSPGRTQRERDLLLGELAQALHSAHRAFPDHPGISYYLARLLSQAHTAGLRDPAQALRIARALAAEHPDPATLELVAIAEAAAGDYAAAAASLEQALREAEQQQWDNTQLRARLQHYRRGEAPPEPSPLALPALPPVDALRIFQGYPNATPF